MKFLSNIDIEFPTGKAGEKYFPCFRRDAFISQADGKICPGFNRIKLKFRNRRDLDIKPKQGKSTLTLSVSLSITMTDRPSSMVFRSWCSSKGQGIPCKQRPTEAFSGSSGKFTRRWSITASKREGGMMT